MADQTPVNESHVARFDLGSEYLRSTDLLVDGVFRKVKVQITQFWPANALTGGDKKKIANPVIEIKAKTLRRVVLNATNQEMLHLVTGFSDGNKTIGCFISLQARYVAAFGDMCLGLRIIPEAGTLIRKGLRKHLGTEAVWTGQAKNGSEIPKPEEESPTGEIES